MRRMMGDFFDDIFGPGFSPMPGVFAWGLTPEIQVDLTAYRRLSVPLSDDERTAVFIEWGRARVEGGYAR